MEFLVFDKNLNLKGEISEYVSAEIERHYHDFSKMVLRTSNTPDNYRLLNKGNIITTFNNKEYGYYIDHISMVMENGVKIIEVFAFSLNYLLDWRVIPKQQVFSGPLPTVLGNYVYYNAINTSANRVIPNLVLGSSPGSFPSVETSATGKTVAEHCFDVCKEAGTSFDVLINHSTKKFEFVVWKGVDRSASQSVNPRVMFSTEFDNVLSYEYFSSDIDYKNTFFVAGEGEGIDRKVLEYGSDIGFDRRELYVDARDLQSEYQTPSGNTVTMSTQEYEDSLLERGKEKLAEFIAVESYESTVDDVQYIIGEDYWVGDIVTFMDSEINVTSNTVVKSVKVVADRQGVRYEPSFGTGTPKLLKGAK